MIDRENIGLKTPPFHATVELGQLRLFYEATGDRGQVELDEIASLSANLNGIQIPPTFTFSLAYLAPDRVSWTDSLNIPLERLLHGEQQFEYFNPIYCGDRLTFHEQISDIYDRNGGALEFVVVDTDVVNEQSTLCVRMRTVAVLTHHVGHA